MKTNHQRGFVAPLDHDSYHKWTRYERSRPDNHKALVSYAEQIDAAPRSARVGNRTSTHKYRTKNRKN
jgi:hypothetical protein